MSSERLVGYFLKRGSVLVAYSGGVDSSVLAKAAHDALGERALAVTFDTPTVSRRELMDARLTARRIGIRHVVVKYTELNERGFVRNPSNRCYLCKRLMAKNLKRLAGRYGIKCVVEGTNADDLEGHRPGYRAIREAGILSPFVELGYRKADVRRLARRYRLNWSKPSNACLASRIPTGRRITRRLLRKVEYAEDYLRSLGLTQVRVRLEGERSDVARVEVHPREFRKAVGKAKEIVESLPFRRVTLDLRGYS